MYFASSVILSAAFTDFIFSTIVTHLNFPCTVEVLESLQEAEICLV